MHQLETWQYHKAVSRNETACMLGYRPGKKQLEFHSVTVTKSTPCKAGFQSHIYCLEPRLPYPSKESANKLLPGAVAYKYVHSWGDRKKTDIVFHSRPGASCPLA